MAKTKRVADAILSGVKTPAQMKAEMAMDRARTVLPQAEREANKAKMLEESAVKDRLYHGTTSDVNEFDPSKARSKTGNINAVLGTFMSDNPAEASRYASEWGTTGGNVMPVYASLKNPYNASYKEMDDLAMGVYRRMMQDPSYDPNRSYRGFDKEGQKRTFEMLEKHEPGALQDAIDFKNKLIEAGHDGIIWNLNGNKEVIAFEPTQVKSAIGNQGTYNPADPDITKAHGGAVKMAGGGAGRKLANKLLPKVEAPSIMTRSDISELAEYIKNREGGYGLRRVERAADEIPRLGELYSQDALREAFSGDNARALMTLKPSEFEKYAIPLEDNLRDESVKNIANLIGIRHKGGFDSVPYFEVNKEEQGLPLLPFISGHEGRHRNRALSAAGEDAGLVQFVPRAELREPFPRRSQEDYIEALKREMSITGNKVLPQVWRESSKNSLEDITMRRPAIDLPDLYAEGGAVKPPAIFEEAQVPFEEIRRQLGMKSGGAVHMQDGGDPQAEIDRMRLELSNSPVIQATPQTPIQRAIGTLGGYMDRAGQFVSESIEPLAEKHPIKHFIADLVGDSFKSAGTALQDYTKTSRDYTEDNPYKRAPITGSGQTMSLDPRMIDVIGFADPATRLAIKGARVGAKAAAPFAKDVAEMASELYMKGEIPGMVPPNLYAVSPEVKPSKVLAPANEQGFYSPTEAAALNLQRKSGSGQAFLNDLLKQENVRPDEINAMGLDTFLKDKKSITATEVQDFIAKNKIQLGEARYQDKPSINKFAMQRGMSEDDAGNVVTLARQGNLEAKKIVDEYANTNITKFQQYQLPGGENYREVVITMPPKELRSPEQLEYAQLQKKMRSGDYSQEDSARFWKLNDELGTEKATEAVFGKRGETYKSSHWDEKNPLAHLRMSDRVTDGKKTLLVDEVQSDWHQAGREQGYASQIGKKVSDEEHKIALNLQQRQYQGDVLSDTEQSQLTDILDRHTASLPGMRVPDAPYKDDWYQLALKRAIKEAIDGGYDRVALPTGNRVAERFDLSKQIESISHQKNPDGTYKIVAVDKNNRHAMNEMSVPEEKLSSIVGKDVAQKIINAEGTPFPEGTVGAGMTKLSGLDLQVGGEGMRKYYDEIYPGYLKKFGKKYGASVGKTTVDADGVAEPLHYMEITPAMREAFKTGIHMKRGGKVSFANNIDAMRLALSKG